MNTFLIFPHQLYNNIDHVSISILAKLTIKVESKVLILSAVSAAYRSATYYELFYSQLV